MSTAPEETSSIDRLVDQLQRLPGIGKRSAERIVFHLLKQPPEEAQAIADSISGMKKTVRQCSICFNICENDPCPICRDPRRDQETVLVVEEPKDLISIEQSGMYTGTYHVLMGRLSPLDGIGPGELTLAALLERVGNRSVKEVILGTSPTLEGDGTALHIAGELEERGARVTRLARGLPNGTPLDAVSKAVLGDAIHGRRSLDG